MRKDLFVKDIKPGQQVNGPFVASAKALRSFARKPGAYLALEISDKTGVMPARVWDNAEVAAAQFDEGDVVAIEGRAEAYQGEIQISITALRRLDEDEYSAEDFIPATDKDVDAILRALLDKARSIGDGHLRALVLSFLEDPAFAAQFKICPGSRRLHHSRLGGLIEHTHSVVEACDLIAPHYPKVDRDMLVAGAILHDIGKIREYSHNLSIDRTTEGALIGHVVIGHEMVEQRIREVVPDMPAEKALLLRHLLLSHHGQLDYGSPKRPKTREALVLHALENLDADLDYFEMATAEARRQGREMSDYDRIFDRQLYVGSEDSQGE